MGSLNLNSSDSIQDQVLRMKKLMSIYQKVLDEESPVIVGGYMNVDRHLPNDTLGRPELKELYPSLDNLTQLNWKPTLHRARHKSSLLDMFLTICPNKMNEVAQGSNGLSEHEVVAFKLHSDSNPASILHKVQLQ